MYNKKGGGRVVNYIVFRIVLVIVLCTGIFAQLFVSQSLFYCHGYLLVGIAVVAPMLIIESIRLLIIR